MPSFYNPYGLTVQGHNDKSDAFRHRFWSAVLARDIGCFNVLQFTTAHESGPTNPANEKAMDLHNNAVGLKIGRNRGTDRELSARCMLAMGSGQLQLAP